MRYVKGMERRMKQDKEAITEILSAIAQAQLALSAAERAFQEMVKSMPICAPILSEEEMDMLHGKEKH